MTTTGSAGHLAPLIPFLDAIRAAGGAVLVASRVSALARVRAAGYDAWPLAEAPDAERAAVFASSRGLPPAQANARALEVFAGLDTAVHVLKKLIAKDGLQPRAVGIPGLSR